MRNGCNCTKIKRTKRTIINHNKINKKGERRKEKGERRKEKGERREIEKQ